MGMLLRRRQVKPTEKKVEPKKAVARPKVEPIVEPQVEPTDTFNYTKSQITLMSTSDLKDLADKLGLDSSLSGRQLKILIVEKLGL